MVTLTVLDKENFESDQLLKLITGESVNGKRNKAENNSQKIALSSGIYAVPISKKLPWMNI